MVLLNASIVRLVVTVAPLGTLLGLGIRSANRQYRQKKALNALIEYVVGQRQEPPCSVDAAESPQDAPRVIAGNPMGRETHKGP